MYKQLIPPDRLNAQGTRDRCLALPIELHIIPALAAIIAEADCRLLPISFMMLVSNGF